MIIVTYKGRPYRQIWAGNTKFGSRVHLEFLDGTKDFWVDAKLVSDAMLESAWRKARRKARCQNLCAECGERQRLLQRADDLIALRSVPLITEADAAAVGLCRRGVKEWKQRHGISGDSVPGERFAEILTDLTDSVSHAWRLARYVLLKYRYAQAA